MAAVQIHTEWALFQAVGWLYLVTIQPSIGSVTLASDSNSNSEHLRMRPKCPALLHHGLPGECLVFIALSWMLTTNETVGKLWSSLRPSLLRQALFSPFLQTAAIFMAALLYPGYHSHTTANDLRALSTQTVGELVGIFVAHCTIQNVISVTGSTSKSKVV